MATGVPVLILYVSSPPSPTDIQAAMIAKRLPPSQVAFRAIAAPAGSVTPQLVGADGAHLCPPGPTVVQFLRTVYERLVAAAAPVGPAPMPYPPPPAAAGGGGGGAAARAGGGHPQGPIAVRMQHSGGMGMPGSCGPKFGGPGGMCRTAGTLFGGAEADGKDALAGLWGPAGIGGAGDGGAAMGGLFASVGGGASVAPLPEDDPSAAPPLPAVLAEYARLRGNQDANLAARAPGPPPI